MQRLIDTPEIEAHGPLENSRGSTVSAFIREIHGSFQTFDRLTLSGKAVRSFVEAWESLRTYFPVFASFSHNNEEEHRRRSESETSKSRFPAAVFLRD